MLFTPTSVLHGSQACTSLARNSSPAAPVNSCAAVGEPASRLFLSTGDVSLKSGALNCPGACNAEQRAHFFADLSAPLPQLSSCDSLTASDGVVRMRRAEPRCWSSYRATSPATTRAAPAEV